MSLFYDEVITFMRNFMSGGLKDNPSLAFGVLTGILRVSKENLFSGLNNPIVNSVLDEKYSKYFGFTVDGNVMAGLEKALYLSDGEKLQEYLRKFMITCISCFDGATEAFYHGMMLGLAAGMSSKYYIRSNRESGEGRFDLVLEPKVHSLPGIIVELKAIKNDAGLTTSATEALKQIEMRHYDADMKDRGIREIVKYGNAFAGKKVEIAFDLSELK